MMARRRKNSTSTVLMVGLAMILLAGFYWLILWAIGIALVAVIAYFLFRWRQRVNWQRKVLSSGIREIDVMQGEEFEKYLGTLFERLGCRVQLTPKSGDFGADLVVEKAGRTIAVQAKRYSTTVGVDAVQAVHASLSYYHAREAWLITNQDFSDAARQLARKSRVRLINRTQLIKLISEVQQDPEKAVTRLLGVVG